MFVDILCYLLMLFVAFVIGVIIGKDEKQQKEEEAVAAENQRHEEWQKRQIKVAFKEPYIPGRIKREMEYPESTQKELEQAEAEGRDVCWDCMRIEPPRCQICCSCDGQCLICDKSATDHECYLCDSE